MALMTLRPNTTRILVLAFVAALGLALLPASAAPTFPALTGRVVDNADLLSPQDEQALTQELKELENKSSDQVVVVTLPSLEGGHGVPAGRARGLGPKQLDNGVLLIVAPNERKVRIEVGYGLEPILTDALSRIIIDNAILPRFRAGDFAGGIKDGVRDITLSLTGDAAEVEARARARHDADQPAIDWFTILLFIAIFVLILYLTRHGTYVVPSGSRRSGGSTWSSGGGGWSSGGGGGGFSGGGGSFGGGGSSGSW
jgi:uncharacterized protein